MAAPSANLIRLTSTSQAALVEYCKKTSEMMLSWDFRARLEQIDKEYYRENLLTKDSVLGQASNRIGDKKKIADIVVPIVEPQIETSLAYLTSVFLTGQPIFGVVSDPTSIDQAKVFEAMIAENAAHGSWVREFMMFFRDGLKYNFQILEIAWALEKTFQPFSSSSQRGLTTEQREIIWQGNCVHRIDPYNSLFDLRVAPAEMHKKGEFCGYTQLFSRVALKEFLQNLPTRMNIKEGMESGLGIINRYYIPQINWDSLVRQNINSGMDWLAWATAQSSDTINYKNIYEVTTRYCRIIPADFAISVPAQNTPQIWKLITINDQVLVYAEKQTNAHNYLPMLFGQPIEDGLGYQTKSMASRLIPLQDTASALWNARLAAKRRSISDRGLYNPLYVREADINSDNPSAKIPIRPAAYGKPLSEAYYPIPFRDEDSTSFVQDGREMMNFANYVSGQNQAQQGQFVKGNKTQSEFDTIMGTSSGRQQMMAQFIEAQTMTPFKEIMKINMLQYATPGQVYSVADKANLTIDPVALRQASLAFKIADGLLPADKLIDTPTLQIAVQAIASNPLLAQAYQLGPMFSYLMKVKGLDLTPFEYTPDQLQANQQQQIQQQLQIKGQAAPPTIP